MNFHDRRGGKERLPLPTPASPYDCAKKRVAGEKKSPVLVPLFFSKIAGYAKRSASPFETTRKQGGIFCSSRSIR